MADVEGLSSGLGAFTTLGSDWFSFSLLPLLRRCKPHESELAELVWGFGRGLNGMATAVPAVGSNDMHGTLQEMFIHDVSGTIVRYTEHLNDSGNSPSLSLDDPRARSTGNPHVLSQLSPL